jgi:hypothetical protein
MFSGSYVSMCRDVPDVDLQGQSFYQTFCNSVHYFFLFTLKNTKSHIFLTLVFIFEFQCSI